MCLSKLNRMGKILRRLIVFMAVLGLILSSVSCFHWRTDHWLKKMRKEATKRIDYEKCAKEGGRVEGIGMFGTPACVHYYKDGGKHCQNKCDCEGKCYQDGLLPIGTPTTGTCQKSEHDDFGCISIIDNGVVVAAFCQD